MAQYAIYEGNLDSFNKKMERIQKKCDKYNIFFQCDEVGEEFRRCKTEDGVEFTGRWVLFEVTGRVICEAGWTVLAILNKEDKGNVINVVNTFAPVPDKYFTEPLKCDHCNTNRHRKQTVLIYNIHTKAYKQVGKQCLKEYTGGLDAEMVAVFESYIKSAEDEGSYHGGRSKYIPYYDIKDVVAYSSYLVEKEGYKKYDPYGSSLSSVDNREDSTKWKVHNMLHSTYGGKDVEKKHYAEARSAISWVRKLKKGDMSNNYLQNLQIICKSGRVSKKNLGFAVSLISAYQSHLRDEARRKAYEESHANEMMSEYVGKSGDKIDVALKSGVLQATIPNEFGTTYLYKFTTEAGNQLIWYASRFQGEEHELMKAKRLTGTVKKHSEFNGVKQTIVTRCKLHAN